MMATETSRLINADSINTQKDDYHIDTPLDSGEAKSLRQVLVDIRAGRVYVGPVLIYTLIAIIGSFMFGYVLGYSSLTEISLSQDTNFKLSDDQFSYFGAIVNIAALFAGLIMGTISDRIGRKPSILISCFPLVLGWSLIAMSFYYATDSEMNLYVLLMIGRFLTGFSTGSLSVLLPTYIIEIAPTSLKGLLGAMHQLAITVGSLTAYLLGWCLQYHIVALIAGAIGVIYSVAALFIPETPRWLLANNQEKTAVRALHKLRGRTDNIDKEINVLTRAIEMEGKLTFIQKVKEFKKMSIIIALVLSLALMFFQQFCGINAIVFYGASIATSANIPSPEVASSFGIGLTQVIVTFIAVILIDLVGRKKLLAFGGILIFIGTSLLAIYYNIMAKGNVHTSSFNFMAVIALVIFITGFSIGWGPIPWVMMSELAPLKVRGIMSGIVTAVNWSFATIVTMFFKKYQKAVTPYGAWWTFAGIILLSIPFVIFLLPETKGKTLEEIQKESNTWFKRRRKN